MTNPQPKYNLLMLSGDNSIARGTDGTFYEMLAYFSQHWARIDILTPRASDATERVIHGNVYVHPASYNRALQPLFIKQFGEQLLAEREYHLVISHDFGFFYNGIGAWWLLRGKNIPLVSEIHHIEGYPIATNLREKLWRQAAQWYLPRMGKRADGVRVVNGELVKQLAQFGIPEEKIHVLHSLYMDYDLYQPQPIDKRYDVLFVGRLASNKGVLLLMDALLQVKFTYPDVKLAIRGEGALKTQIEAFITEHNLQNNVIFVPRVANSSAMATLYNQAKMLVCASTVEGNPRVTVEAMACRVPVISTRVGIMPELIEDGTSGYLVDWDSAEIAEKIKLLLENTETRTQIGDAGREAAQGFEAETIIRQYALTYHQIIEQNASFS